MATSANVNDALPLMLIILVLGLLHGNGVQSEVNPDLQLRLTQSGLDCAARVAMDMLYEKAQKIKISDRKGSITGFIGTVNCELTNIHVKNSAKASSSVVVSPENITFTFSNSDISIQGNWSYNFTKWCFSFYDSGCFTVSMSDISISLSLSLGLDSTGHPTIGSTDCSCSISSISFKLRGGASWLYTLFIGFVKGSILSQLQTKICEEATAAINGSANDWLSSFPLQVTVASDCLLDYGLLSAPDLHDGFLDIQHKAAFCYKDNTTEPPILAEPFPNVTTTDKMVTFWMSDSVLNAFAYAIYKQNVLNYTFTHSDLPDRLKSFLNTTCSRENSCMGNVFPELSICHPNSVVEMEMAVSKAPSTNISNGQIQVTLSGVVTFHTRLSNDSVVKVLNMKVHLNVIFELTLNAAVLKCNVTHLVPTVEVVSSSLGSISSDALSQALGTSCYSLLIPALNKICQKGVPFPVLSGIRFNNTELEMQNHCLYTTADVECS